MSEKEQNNESQNNLAEEQKTDADAKGKTKKPLWRKILRIIVIVIIVFLLLNVLLYVVLSIPYTQKKITSIASKQLTSLLNTDVRIGKIQYKLFNDIDISNLFVADQKNDTLLYVKNLDVQLAPWDFIAHKKISVKYASIDSLYLNVYADSIHAPFNYQFIIDQFASDSDTLSIDKKESSFPNIKVGLFTLNHSKAYYNILDEPDTLKGFDPHHIRLDDINLVMQGHSLKPSNLHITLNHFSLNDPSILNIKNMFGNVYIKDDVLRLEEFRLTTDESYIQPELLNFNTHTMEFKVILNNDSIFLPEFQTFMPGLDAFDRKLTIELEANGILPTVNISKLNLSLGSERVLQMSGFISSYEDLENALIDLNVKKLYISQRNLPKFYRLIFPEENTVPEIISTSRFLNFKASLKGELSKFALSANAQTKQGIIDLQTKGSTDTAFVVFDTKSQLNIKDFNLGELLQTEDLKKLSLTADIEASQKKADDLRGRMNANIEGFGFMKDRIVNMPFEVTYTPSKVEMNFATRQNFGSLKADIWMIQKEFPDLYFDLHARQFRIGRFIDNKKWDNPALDFSLKGMLKSFNIDNLIADITLDNFRMEDTNFDYNPGPLNIKAWKDSDKSQNIKISSSLINANLKGMYKFSTISQELSGMMHKYISVLFDKKPKSVKNSNNFKFDLSIDNTKRLGEVVELPIEFIRPMQINGLINTIGDNIAIKSSLPEAELGGIMLEKFETDINLDDTSLKLDIATNLLAGGLKYSAKLQSEVLENELRSDLAFKSDTSKIDLNGNLQFNTFLRRDKKNKLEVEVDMMPTNFKLADFVIDILPGNAIYYEDNILEVNNLGLGLNGGKYMELNGRASEKGSDTLRIAFTNAEVGELLTGFGVDDINATIDGDVRVASVLGQPEIYTDNLKIADISAYNETIGTLSVRSAWEKEIRSIKVDAALENNENDVLTVDGTITPASEDIDFDININRFGLSWLQPMAKDFLNKVDGDISSHLKVDGKMSNPKTSGFLGFNNMEIGVDYTNVTYYISDTIHLAREQIGLQDLIIKDSEGNSAKVNADIKYEDFNDIQLKLDMQTKNLMVLNTQSRADSLFYGKVYASGNINIDGNQENQNVNMRIRNDKNSNLDVTLPQYLHAMEYKNIVYINAGDSLSLTGEQLKMPDPESFPMNLDIRLTLTPDMHFTVIINPDTDDMMNVRGEGDIRFKYNMENSNMSLFGNYLIEQGSVRLNLQNVYKIEFKIMEGSKLEFIGDPLKTKFNVKAYKRVRADLKALDPTFAQEFGNTRVNVDCILGISGDMENMNITYDIELVDASDEQVSLLNSLINTSEAKIRQFAYLVTTGSFYPSGGGSGANFSDSMWTNLASTALSAGLNAIMGKVLGDNWHVTADLSNNEKTVSATTNLFNDKLRLSANVGYRDEGENIDESQMNQSSFIGNIDAEYILTPNWSLKVFNHSNNQFYRSGSTIQGVGVTYSKNASSFKNLFQSNRRWRRNINRTEGSKRSSDDVVMENEDELKNDTISIDSIKIEKLQTDSLVIQNEYKKID